MQILSWKVRSWSPLSSKSLLPAMLASPVSLFEMQISGAPGWLSWLSVWVLILAQVMTSWCQFRPHAGLLTNRVEPAWDFLSVSLSPSPSPTYSLSFSLKINNHKKKKKKCRISGFAPRILNHNLHLKTTWFMIGTLKFVKSCSKQSVHICLVEIEAEFFWESQEERQPFRGSYKSKKI